MYKKDMIDFEAFVESALAPPPLDYMQPICRCGNEADEEGWAGLRVCHHCKAHQEILERDHRGED